MKKKDEIRFLGHNCFLIVSAETFLLIDPWLSSKGAFFGSWYQYPRNHHLQREIVELSYKKLGYVYFSHEHQDHFDIDTLRKLNPKTRVLIPDFKDKYLRRTILKLGFLVEELSEESIFYLNDGFTARIFITDIGINHDSAILVETGNISFFNQNDCKIFDRLSSLSLPKVTYYAVQYSGATWHPVCYTNYPIDEKRRISQAKSESKIKNVIKGIRALNPKFFIPCAGPAIFPFLEASLSLGEGNIFIHHDQLSSRLAAAEISNVLYLRPGDLIEESAAFCAPISPPKLEDLDLYKLEIEDAWDRIDLKFCPTELRKAILDRLDQIRDIEFSCKTILKFQWGASSRDVLFIDLERKKIIDNLVHLPENLFIVSAERKYFALMHSGARWQDIYLSMRASLFRRPDVFNNFINLFLFSDVSNIRDNFHGSLSISRERIVRIGKNGARYLMDRFCPHQGADLSCAEINDDNEVVCPRHGWRFSLNDSGSLSSGGFSLHSELIPDRTV